MGNRKSSTKEFDPGTLQWPTYDDNVYDDSSGGADDGGVSGMVERREKLKMATREFWFADEDEGGIPVTIVAGALGAGKTTLMERVVKGVRGLKLGVIINDFATLNVDYLNIQSNVNESDVSADVQELSNGCICCSLSEGFEDSVHALLVDAKGTGRVEYIVVETSGVTDAAAMVSWLQADSGKMAGVRLENVVFVVDADVAMQSDSAGLKEQLKCADVVVLNKMDLIRCSEDAEALERRVASCVGDEAETRIIRATACDVPVTSVLSVDEIKPEREAFGRIQQGSERAAGIKHIVRPTSLQSMPHHHQSRAEHGSNEMNHEFASTVWRSSVRLDPVQFQRALSCCKTLRRVKGSIRFKRESTFSDPRIAFQISGKCRFDVSLSTNTLLPAGSHLVIIAETQAQVDAFSSSLDKCKCSNEIEASATRTSDWEWLSHDSRFDVVEQRGGFVYFALTGKREFGMSDEALRKQYAIYPDVVQRAFATKLNFLSSDLLAIADEHAPGVFACGVALNGYTKEPAAQELFAKAAEAVFTSHYQPVMHCRCGA